MVARIGLPGNSYHTFERGLTKAEARAWCDARLAERYPAGSFPIDARASIISEKEADKARYRDGTRCY